MATLILRAPLAGWCAPPEEIPDAVFAQRMLGDGVAIDPTGNELHAPCDGEIISIAASRHAIALRHADGAEILMHVGIDTVGLAGEGFELLVRKGDRVRTGDLLLRFDLDVLARKAASLVTPIVVTNGDRFRITSTNINRPVAVGDALLTLEDQSVAADAAAPKGAPVVSESVVVNHAHGIHARPAALIARHAKGLPFELEARARGRGVDPRSAVALMSLGVKGGDEIVIVGFTPAAAAAVAELAGVVRGLEKLPAHKAASSAAPRASVSTDPANLRGVVASRGFAMGAAFYLHAAEIPVVEAGTGADRERAALERARAAVRERLGTLARSASHTAREILAAHLELLDDHELTGAAARAVSAGKSAAFAWRTSLRTSAAALRATGDPLLIERIDDLLDLERQVLVELGGVVAEASVEIPRGAILIATDLKPSQIIGLPAGALGGIALAAGGPTSHVAILAAVMGIPMLVAVGPALLSIDASATVILDADAGTLSPVRGVHELAAAQAELARRSAARARELAAAQRPCHMASGERIEVFANLAGSIADAQFALAQGAEGCGLLRTEFLFLDRATAPDEREQLACYEQVAAALGGKPLVIRTLDAGGDKPIPYLPLPAEENPALGLRGVRTSLWRPELLEVQLRAMLRAPAGQCRVLLPMITDVEEVRIVRGMLTKLANELGLPLPQLGVMIETPAAALLADQLAREVEFLSIGTNDLAQYTLAMDRGHAELAARIDGVHPAVLRMIAAVTAAARESGCPVAVCGGLASDPAAVPLLLGLGVTELSAVPASIPPIKALIGSLNLDACRSLAQAALALPSSVAVRALLAAQKPASEVHP